MGDSAGDAITTGGLNTIIGTFAGSGCSTVSNNTAIGAFAFDAGTGADNTAVGSGALGGSSNSGTKNAAFGKDAGNAISSGIQNTLVGSLCGDAVTTGNYNTFVGYLAGTFDVDLISGEKNTIIGSYSHTSATDSDNQIVMGHDVTGNGDNTLCFGVSSTDSSIAFGATTITAPSDERYKEDIADSTAGLSFINDLRPVTFKWKKAKDVPSNHKAYIADGKEGCNDRVMLSNGETNHGFIAQEVKTAIDAHPEIKDGFAMWSEEDREDKDGNPITGGRQRVALSELVPILTKAIQELSAKNDALEARIATLEG